MGKIYDDLIFTFINFLIHYYLIILIKIWSEITVNVFDFLIKFNLTLK
jgi:hypothetical protein